MVPVKLCCSETSFHYVSDKVGKVTPHVELLLKIAELRAIAIGFEKASDTIQQFRHKCTKYKSDVRNISLDKVTD